MTEQIGLTELEPTFYSSGRRTVEDYKTPLIPRWAEDLIAQVCEDEGMEDARPRVEWVANYGARWVRPPMQPDLWGTVRSDEAVRVRKQSVSSSGVTWSGLGKILVRAGTDPVDTKLVVLHELAHYLLPAREHHGIAFWRKAWELYIRYEPDPAVLERWRHREAAYKQTSERGFRQVDGSIWTQRAVGVHSEPTEESDA